MKMTPLDIQNHKLRNRLWGQDTEEVAIFLEMVATEMEERIKENSYLTEEHSRAKAQLAEFREREQTLKETLMMAQKIAQDMKNNVVKEAQVVLAQAELEGDQIIRRAYEDFLNHWRRRREGNSHRATQHHLGGSLHALHALHALDACSLLFHLQSPCPRMSLSGMRILYTM